MKRNAFVILSLACATSIILPLAATAATEGPYTYTVSGGKATITDFDASYSGDLSITNELGGCPVTTIDSKAFFGCSNLISVTIPTNVITIGWHAFSDCSSLTSVTIPDSITIISLGTFKGCTGLTSVTIPDSVTAIEWSAFSDCTSLPSVTIPASVTGIRIPVFDGCTSLTAIDVCLSNTVYSSMDGVLYNATRTTLHTFPEGKTGKFIIPSGVTSVSGRAFYDCTRLTGVTFPDSVTTIENSAFYGCIGLVSVDIPGSVTTISDLAFFFCSNLTSVIIRDGVTTIGSSVFNNCTSLTSVSIPASVTTLDGSVFYFCRKLDRVYLSGNPPTIRMPVFNYTRATLYYLPAYAASWPTTFDNRPTKLWNPSFAASGCTAGGVSCVVTGSPPIPIALEATTNLNAGTWVRLCTTNLTANSMILDDPDSSFYPARFYRIVGP